MHPAINISNIYIDLDEAEKIYEQHDSFFVHGMESNATTMCMLVIDCCRYYIHEKMTNLKFNVGEMKMTKIYHRQVKLV